MLGNMFTEKAAKIVPQSETSIENSNSLQRFRRSNSSELVGKKSRMLPYHCIT